MKNIIRIFVFILAGTLMLCILFLLADIIFDERIANWFEYYFFDSEDVYYPELGYILSFPKLRWVSLKNFAFLITVIIGVLWASSLVLAVYTSKKRIMLNTEETIKQFFKSNEETKLMLPEGCEELALYLKDLKVRMLQDEYSLRMEMDKKHDLITYLAHDLRTPLTSVIGYLNLLDEATDMPVEQREKYVHITLDKAYRLEKMINEFFEITRYNAEQIVLAKEKIDLYYMIVQLSDELFPILTQRGNTVKINADENLSVYGDPDKLARVFNNVLKNAAAYSYPDTEIVIAAIANETSVIITFANKGKTIPEDKLDSIFEKFYRLDEARTSDTGGAGLGLAIAKEIISLHNGTIMADSRNNQTIFTITLPRQS